MIEKTINETSDQFRSIIFMERSSFLDSCSPRNHPQFSFRHVPFLSPNLVAFTEKLPPSSFFPCFSHRPGHVFSFIPFEINEKRESDESHTCHPFCTFSVRVRGLPVYIAQPHFVFSGYQLPFFMLIEVHFSECVHQFFIVFHPATCRDGSTTHAISFFCVHC